MKLRADYVGEVVVTTTVGVDGPEHSADHARMVSCAVPSTAGSSQYRARASQKVTNPGETDNSPAFTVAVSVTVVPLTAVFEDRAKIVTVLGTTRGCRCASKMLFVKTKNTSRKRSPRRPKRHMPLRRVPLSHSEYTHCRD